MPLCKRHQIISKNFPQRAIQLLLHVVLLWIRVEGRAKYLLKLLHPIHEALDALSSPDVASMATAADVCASTSARSAASCSAITGSCCTVINSFVSMYSAIFSTSVHLRAAVGAEIFLPERILFEYVSAVRASNSILRITNYLAAIRVIFAPVCRFPFSMHHLGNVGGRSCAAHR